MTIETLRQMADQGISFLPLKPRSKLPMEKGWPAKRYLASTIKEALRRGCNIGVNVKQSGLLVIDVDPRNGGGESLVKLAQGFPMPETPIVRSGRGDGGHHIYFRAPPGIHLPTKVEAYPGIDFKSSGQVVAPGSIHPDTGQPYTAVVGRHDANFRLFAENVLRRHEPKISDQNDMFDDVPSSISDNLVFPHLAKGFQVASRRSSRPCVLSAEAPKLEALRAASNTGWAVIRYSDEEALDVLVDKSRDDRPFLPGDIALPELNRLGRNRGLAIRGVDPRDVVRIPGLVFETWQGRHGQSDLVTSVKWYRSSVDRHDEPGAFERLATIPAQLLARAEKEGDPATLFLRENDQVLTGAGGSLAKRTADLRASWSEPNPGVSRYMLEDGILPVRYSPLRPQEVAAQKFFTIDGDASVPLLFSSRLFQVWARATMTRSPSWSSRFSITRTFETFPIPEQFIVFNDGEGGRASLRAGPRAKNLSNLLEDFDANSAASGRVLPFRGVSIFDNDYSGGIYGEVDEKLLHMINLPPNASDLELLERLVEMNRMSGSEDRLARRRRYG